MKKVVVVLIIIICIIYGIIKNYSNTKKVENISNNSIIKENDNDIKVEDKAKEIDDWRLVLVNYENALPKDFEPELSSIDKTREFDSRAIEYLMQMLQDMKAQGYKNIWPQSTYRSVARQEEIFNKKVKSYMSMGKTKEEAETLTLQKINKPGTSEHNLGLAVDFNNVDYNFEKSKEYKWLMENAENYGFVLRYPRDKKDITKVDCEPWHWRYVGEEHAKKMNELNMCLEEYIEYLKEN